MKHIKLIESYDTDLTEKEVVDFMLTKTDFTWEAFNYLLDKTTTFEDDGAEIYVGAIIDDRQIILYDSNTNETCVTGNTGVLYILQQVFYKQPHVDMLYKIAITNEEKDREYSQKQLTLFFDMVKSKFNLIGFKDGGLSIDIVQK